MQFVKRGPNVPEHLLKAHEEGRVIFFCGAGISYPAGLPGFAGLVKKLYSRLEIDPDPLQEAAIKAKRHDTAVGLLEAKIAGGRQAVRKKIAKILDPGTLSPNATATHDALLTLAQCRKHRTRLVTTNFDRLFEHVIAMRKIAIKRFEAPLIPIPKSRWDGLIYLHGLLHENPTASNLDNLVISSGDFGLAYLTERWAARFVSELLRNFVVCFVGYSIDDPVLRYMMDALAADRLLGESPSEMFAFGSYSKGEKHTCTAEWDAKNVTPILYREHRNHFYLHKTLRAWASTYQDGVLGKEHIIIQYAMARPDTATSQDDFVSRMRWALSDPSGLPAKRFADLDPVPSLDWLKPISEDRFGHDDLVRFGVPPKERKDENLVFSLVRRPAPYDLAPQMTLATSAMHDGRYDEVMFHLARWLTRHLNNPDLLLWLVRQGGRLHSELSHQIADRLDELVNLQHAEDSEKLNSIRENAPNAIPDTRMRRLWQLLLSGRVVLIQRYLDLYRWKFRFARDGLTTALRLELCEMLTPRVLLCEPIPWPFDNDEKDQGTVDMRQLVDWSIVLSVSRVHESLRGLGDNEHWRAALLVLLPDFTRLLRDVLDLMRELDGADKKSDMSYYIHPSISEHPQNRNFRDWTALIDLNRDAWLATSAESPEQARLAAEAWSRVPYPLFLRLAFFAAAQDSIIPRSLGLEWLLRDDHWWLWSIETQRETMRLLVALAPRLNEDKLERLEGAILAGPPREMFRDDIDEERWTQIQDEYIWLRLIKLRQGGAELNPVTQERLSGLSARHPNWRLLEDQHEEFPSWRGDGSEQRVHVTTPRDRDELVTWLKKNPEPDEWQRDNWPDRCREDFEDAASALTILAEEGNWPTGRWREALQCWSEDELSECSWQRIAPVLTNIPTEMLQELRHQVSWWLEKLSRSFEGQEPVFFSLCERLLELDYEIDDEDRNFVGRAINHPVGLVTQALLRWWYRQDLGDGQGLSIEPKRWFTQLCNTEKQSFRHGRLVLAAHLISLFRVDREWTRQFLLPLFEWGNSKVEARSAWEGFLWSSRLYPSLMEELRPAFLDTANHYNQLGRHSEQYASLLTFVGLDLRDVFQQGELALAMRTLPQSARERAAETFFRAVDSAGDQRADYWRNRAAPYLKSIWPKTHDAISPEVSVNFGQACIAAGNAFPEALEEVRVWLQPLQFPGQITHALHEAKLDKQFPESALELLYRVYGDETQEDFPNLRVCLDAIHDEECELEQDPRFQGLSEILQTQGINLRK